MRMRSHQWSEQRIFEHAESYSEERFIDRLRTLVQAISIG